MFWSIACMCMYDLTCLEHVWLNMFRTCTYTGTWTCNNAHSDMQCVWCLCVHIWVRKLKPHTSLNPASLLTTNKAYCSKCWANRLLSEPHILRKEIKSHVATANLYLIDYPPCKPSNLISIRSLDKSFTQSLWHWSLIVLLPSILKYFRGLDGCCLI